ncbi:MAG: hypothetical protein HY901_11695 [Deltaproteobacteria bacterium]|nr:hypothetical protein [Deltaproteobacteria bacterium]
MRLPPAALAASITFLAGAPASASSSDADSWTGPDKALHFCASALIASVGYQATALASDDHRTRIALGAGLALTAGVAKELWDLTGRGDPSWKDMTWDLVGTATAVLLTWADDRLFLSHPAPERTTRAAPAPLLDSPFAFLVPRGW